MIQAETQIICSVRYGRLTIKVKRDRNLYGQFMTVNENFVSA